MAAAEVVYSTFDKPADQHTQVTELVRATGARDAANDPALAGILAQASQYVIGTRPATGGAVTLFFDGAALERDITAAGRTVWGVERPLVLIVLTGGPASGAFESRRQVETVMDSAGNRRGQPINVVRPARARSYPMPLNANPKAKGS